MKKLMIVLVAVAMGIAANAASWDWASAGRFFDGTGTTGKMSDGTSVYLMFTSSYSLDTLVSDFASGGIQTDKAIKTAAISGGMLAGGESTSVSASVTGEQTAYMAIVYGERLFISSTKDTMALEIGTGDIIFDSQGYRTRYNNTVNTLKADNLASAGYTGAGWYTAVPEPTSGLLLILGMAGLALRRRRA